MNDKQKCCKCCKITKNFRLMLNKDKRDFYCCDKCLKIWEKLWKRHEGMIRPQNFEVEYNRLFFIVFLDNKPCSESFIFR